MNIISWNIRDLGRLGKRFLVKDFLHLHCAKVCCLQESKLDEISLSTWRKIGGNRLDQFEFVPARGSVGGIILGWNSILLSSKLERVGAFRLTVNFCCR